MKSRLRKISVDDVVYLWSISYKYNLGDTFTSSFFFSVYNDKSIRVQCFFKTLSHYYLGCHHKEGTEAIKNGEKHMINLNRPVFASELIRFIVANKVNFMEQKRYRFDNANDFFKEMGYSFLFCEFKS